MLTWEPGSWHLATLLGPKWADQPRAGKDWPMLGGGPDRAGLEVASLGIAPELAWKLDTGGRIVGATAVRDGKAFVGSDAGKIFAADLKTGKQICEFATGAAVRCSPAVAPDLDQPGTAIIRAPILEGVLRLKSKPLYNFPKLAAMGMPLVAGHHLCFATVSGKVCLTETDGKERWAFQLGSTCHATAVAADGFLVVGGDDGHLYAFRAK